MAKDEGGGFQEAAGLVRYFDEEEDTSINIDPRLVIAGCFLVAVTTMLFNWQCSPGGACF